MMEEDYVDPAGEGSLTSGRRRRGGTASHPWIETKDACLRLRVSEQFTTFSRSRGNRTVDGARVSSFLGEAEMKGSACRWKGEENRKNKIITYDEAQRQPRAINRGASLRCRCLFLSHSHPVLLHTSRIPPYLYQFHIDIKLSDTIRKWYRLAFTAFRWNKRIDGTLNGNLADCIIMEKKVLILQIQFSTRE